MAKKSFPLAVVEYIPVRAMIALLGLLPRGLAIRTGIGLARAFRAVTGGRRDAAMTNLRIAFPDLSDPEREAIFRRSIDNLGRVLGEVAQFRRYDAARLAELVEFSFESDDAQTRERSDYFYRERRKGRGAIIASPHLGNWEIGVMAYSALREPLTYLARPLDNPLLEDYTERMRSRFGNRPVAKTNGLLAVMDILRRGGIVGLLPDVNVQQKDGFFVPFFGVEACTTGGVAMLAKRTNAMIVPMCTPWEESLGRYVVRYGDIIEPSSTGDRHRDVIETTAAMTLAMERFIRAYPDQWIWTHKRWKTRPDGEPPIY